MALGMTLNGAAGATLDSMRVALAMAGAPIEEINAGYRSLIDLLRGLDSRVEFAIANSIWARQGMPFSPAFLEAGKTTFDAEIRAMDFAAPATLTTINQWVSDQTRGKIPTIVDQIAPDDLLPGELAAGLRPGQDPGSALSRRRRDQPEPAHHAARPRAAAPCLG
jgi:serpin B